MAIERVDKARLDSLPHKLGEIRARGTWTPLLEKIAVFVKHGFPVTRAQAIVVERAYHETVVPLWKPRRPVNLRNKQAVSLSNKGLKL